MPFYKAEYLKIPEDNLLYYSQCVGSLYLHVQFKFLILMPMEYSSVIA